MQSHRFALYTDSPFLLAACVVMLLPHVTRRCSWTRRVSVKYRRARPVQRVFGAPSALRDATRHLLPHPASHFAPQAVLWELTVLRSHYHPAILRLLPCICNPNDTHSPDPIEFLAAFDPAKVTFRPPLRRPLPHPLETLRSKRQGKRANGRAVSVRFTRALPAASQLVACHGVSPPT